MTFEKGDRLIFLMISERPFKVRQLFKLFKSFCWIIEFSEVS